MYHSLITISFTSSSLYWRLGLFLRKCTCLISISSCPFSLWLGSFCPWTSLGSKGVLFWGSSLMSWGKRAFLSQGTCSKMRLKPAGPKNVRGNWNVWEELDSKEKKIIIMLLFCSLSMKNHPVIPRKALKRSYDCVDGDLVNIITLTPTLHTGY